MMSLSLTLLQVFSIQHDPLFLSFSASWHCSHYTISFFIPNYFDYDPGCNNKKDRDLLPFLIKYFDFSCLAHLWCADLYSNRQLFLSSQFVTEPGGIIFVRVQAYFQHVDLYSTVMLEKYYYYVQVLLPLPRDP